MSWLLPNNVMAWLRFETSTRTCVFSLIRSNAARLLRNATSSSVPRSTNSNSHFGRRLRHGAQIVDVERILDIVVEHWLPPPDAGFDRRGRSQCDFRYHSITVGAGKQRGWNAEAERLCSSGVPPNSCRFGSETFERRGSQISLGSCRIA